MEKVLLNFNLILILTYFYRVARHGLHILQLENYYLDRYALWMKRYLKKVLNIKTIILLIIPTILIFINDDIVNRVGLILEAFILLYLIFSFQKRKEKKPFVVTARIKSLCYIFSFICYISSLCKYFKL